LTNEGKNEPLEGLSDGLVGEGVKPETVKAPNFLGGIGTDVVEDLPYPSSRLKKK